MSILHGIARSLTKYPSLKRDLKNVYQVAGNIISDKRSWPNNIKCVSKNDGEHLFGYYDKSPWDATGTKMIYMRVKSASIFPASSDIAEIILKDLNTQNEKVIAQTHSWNVQQGCMLQWLGPDYKDKIIYNDFREGQYCSIILNINTGKERKISKPVYSVSNDGAIALSLDFSRLNSFRAGYGYVGLTDKTVNEKYPDSPCIWRISLDEGKIKPLFTYRSLFEFNTRLNMEDAFHKVNHIMINPAGDRFMFLHRWILNGVKYDRLITSDMEGEDLFILLDDDMVSHCNWKNDRTIIAWANTHKYGVHYYLLNDKSDEISILGEGKLNVDGHPSYSPDGRYIITDTYPDFKRKQKLLLYDTKTQEVVKIAEVYANIKYKNETRCDLHPRWKRDSSEICFDGSLERFRQVYTLKITK